MSLRLAGLNLNLLQERSRRTFPGRTFTPGFKQNIILFLKTKEVTFLILGGAIFLEFRRRNIFLKLDGAIFLEFIRSYFRLIQTVLFFLKKKLFSLNSGGAIFLEFRRSYFPWIKKKLFSLNSDGAIFL